MRVRLRWSLTIETGDRTRPEMAGPGSVTLEANDGGMFEADGQPDAGEMMTTRLEPYDRTSPHGPDYGRFH